MLNSFSAEGLVVICEQSVSIPVSVCNLVVCADSKPGKGTFWTQALMLIYWHLLSIKTNIPGSKQHKSNVLLEGEFMQQVTNDLLRLELVEPYTVWEEAMADESTHKELESPSAMNRFVRKLGGWGQGLVWFDLTW